MKKIMLMILCLSSTTTYASNVEWTLVNDTCWSNALDGQYNNFDLDGTKPINIDGESVGWSEGLVIKTDATEACKAVGGVLPTMAQFLELFKIKVGSQSKFDELYSKIKDVIWTRNVYPAPTYQYGVVPTDGGYLVDDMGRYSKSDKASVVCVKRKDFYNGGCVNQKN